MIHTLTFSPALDYVVDLKSFEVGAINRTAREHAMPGGKGINVSLVLSNLGRPSVASGFLAGFTGDYIEKELLSHNVKADFVRVDGLTRINVKIRCGEETAINGQGPNIPEEKIEELLRKLERLGPEDLLVISGTVPSTLPSNIYEIILERIKDTHVSVIVDATKSILLNTLKYKPLLVKPNKEELGEMFGVVINNDDELIAYSKKLLDMGALNVIVSLGGDGAFMVGRDVPPIFLKAPQGKVINTVGAGDSLVAGFIDEYLNSGDLLRAFRQGVATGSASAFSDGLATVEEVKALLQRMQ